MLLIVFVFQPCTSTCRVSQGKLDGLIQALSHDEISSSIEIVKQLQKALTDDSERESEEERIKIETEIKQEKDSEEILVQISEGLDDLESDLQVSGFIWYYLFPSYELWYIILTFENFKLNHQDC